MKCWAIWFIVFALLLLVVYGESRDDEEPHAYTISFFQFDPKDIGVGEEVKKKTKKEIKPSDAKLLNQLGNYSNTGNNSAWISTTNDSLQNDIEKEQQSHVHWNKTENKNSSQASPANNNTKLSITDYESYKRNETELDARNIQARNITTINPLQQTKNVSTKQADRTEAMSEKNKDEIASNNQTLQKNSAVSLNNSTLSVTISPLNLELTTSKKNVTLSKEKFDTNNTAAFNKTMTNEKRSRISKPTEMAANRKALVLNPNPSPSLAEANLHLKSPQFQTVHKKTPQVTVVGNKIFENNSTKAVHDKYSASLIEKSVTLAKTGKAKEQHTKPGRKPNESNKKNKEQSVKVKFIENKNITKNETAEKLSKLEKDKKINEEIQENAKKIKPVENKVDSATISKNTTTISGIKKQSIFKKNNQNKSPLLASKSGIQSKSQITRHREMISHFIPGYNVNPQERTMGFQLGSLKHPKHNLYPNCHHCPQNSTYAHCVRKATLNVCNNGLNNICFTKSRRTNDIITYQMGCADHKMCITAKAFPCKDGSKDCFTCCQFDKCNSSPHHGDYELDELNMAEIEFDTKNTANALSMNWLYHGLTILLQVIVMRLIQ